MIGFLSPPPFYGALAVPGGGTVTYIDEASALSNTVTIPSGYAAVSGATQYLIIGYAARGDGTTAPSLPAAEGWTDGGTASNGVNTSARWFWKIADSGSENFGTATNASRVGVQVFRIDNGPVDVIGASGTATTGNDTDIDYPTVSLEVTDGTSWISEMIYLRANTPIVERNPDITDNFLGTGTTGRLAIYTSDGDQSSWPADTETLAIASETVSIAVEIRVK
jgi:hypothetical protein